MDKLVYDSRGTTISNDGATIMKVRQRCSPAHAAARA
jgi:chaperonin GroEL (HSP60 family)